MDNWLDNEVDDLARENKRKIKNNNDTYLMIIFIMLLLPFLVAQLSAGETRPHRVKIGRSPSPQSAQWKCSACGRYVYSENPDWKGDFYCRCGRKKGE